VFTRSFAWVGWLTNNLPRTDDGYTLYNLGSAGIALAVMFPAAFFAGMTLPLFTIALLRRGHGEAAIGRVYAANTVGAILGVVAAVHLLVPLVGLHLSLVLAGMADLALGFYLLRFLAERSSGRQLAGLGVASVASVVLALVLGRPDPIAQVSGVFRTGKFFDPKTVQVVYLRDGKTSTVSLVFYPAVGTASIATNGKPDASLAVDLALPPAADEITMVMAGSLPLAAHPAPGEIGIIGWGSGLTTHTVLGSPRVRKVDNVEIEPAMVEGARFFGERVGRAYADPRSTILYDDARTYFATGGKAYDVIISEPSNPWVSGVANLFTEEFYGFLRRHLREEGVLVQWLQSYELDDALLARMVAALQKNFPHVDVYLTNHADLLFLASNEPLKPVDLSRIDSAALRDEAARVGLAGPADYQLRRIGDARLLAAMTRLMGAKGHSDFHPVVALQAPRSRFLGARADLLHLLVENGMPVLDTLGQRSLVPRAEPVSATEFSRYYNSRRRAIAVVDTLATGEADPWLPGKYAEVDGKLRQLRLLSGKPVQSEQLAEWSDAVAIAAANSIGFLPAADLQAGWIAPAWLAPGQPEAVSLAMAAYSAAARRDAPAMREAAVRLLSLEGSGLSSMLREQMLVIAMSGAAAQGDMAAVGEIESRFGPGIDRYTDYTKVRSFLLAWADK
jgi:hypothetical protein